jgi:hypothetical protein
MVILFEESVYRKEDLDKIGFPESYYVKNKGGNNAKIHYVGYLYSSDSENPIFILPKVFLKPKSSTSTAVSTINDGLNILPLVDDKGNTYQPDTYNIDDCAFEIAISIYGAILRYNNDNPDNEIVKSHKPKITESLHGEDEQTLIDSILSLKEFAEKNQNIISFKTINDTFGSRNINWKKTIEKENPVLQKGKPVYVNFWNKGKTPNYDEELITLFYSVLKYLNEKLPFRLNVNFNYELAGSSEIESMISSGKGTSYLRSIRYKYYSDLMIKLWTLLYTFFERSEAIRSIKGNEEVLVTSSFYRIFEEMIDKLIGDKFYGALKENKDGKLIDHIFKDKSLLDNSKIYYIGDSKYYSYDTDINGISNEKQFTYAKNVIQLCIDISNKQNNISGGDSIISDVRYRDDNDEAKTEGYNPTPNFFIVGDIIEDSLHSGEIIFGGDHLSLDNTIIKKPFSFQFEDRLFDRDTLLLCAFRINFLYVLQSYAVYTFDVSENKKIRKKIRSSILNNFNDKYIFLKVTPKKQDNAKKYLKDFVDDNFRKFAGQMYHSPGTDFIVFAFEHDDDIISKIKDISGECTVSKFVPD